jgi:hypothetical protein
MSVNNTIKIKLYPPTSKPQFLSILQLEGTIACHGARDTTFKKFVFI